VCRLSVRGGRSDAPDGPKPTSPDPGCDLGYSSSVLRRDGSEPHIGPAGREHALHQAYREARCAPSRLRPADGRNGRARQGHRRSSPRSGAASGRDAELARLLAEAPRLVGKWYWATGFKGEPLSRASILFGYNCQRKAITLPAGAVAARAPRSTATTAADGRSMARPLRARASTSSPRPQPPLFPFFATTIRTACRSDDSLAEYAALPKPLEPQRYQPQSRPRAATRHGRRLTAASAIVDLVGRLGLDKDTLILFAKRQRPIIDSGLRHGFFGGAGLPPAQGLRLRSGIRIRSSSGAREPSRPAGRRPRPRSMTSCRPPRRGRGPIPRPPGLDAQPPVALRGRDRPGRRGRLYMEFPAYGGQQMAVSATGRRPPGLSKTPAPPSSSTIWSRTSERRTTSRPEPARSSPRSPRHASEHRPSLSSPPGLDGPRP